MIRGTAGILAGALCGGCFNPGAGDGGDGSTAVATTSPGPTNPGTTEEAPTSTEPGMPTEPTSEATTQGPVGETEPTTTPNPTTVDDTTSDSGVETTAGVEGVEFDVAYDIPLDMPFAVIRTRFGDDGYDDLAVSAIDGGLTLIDGETRVAFPQVAAAGSFSLAAYDFTADGYTDILSASRSDMAGMLDVFVVGGTGGVPAVTTGGGGIDCTIARWIARGAVDQGGDDDAAIACYGSSSVLLLKGAGASLQPQVPVKLNKKPVAAVLADVVGTPDADLVIVTEAEAGELRVIPGDGTFMFAADAMTKPVAWPYGLAIADLDGRGKVDVVIPQGNGTGTCTLVTGGEYGLGELTTVDCGASPYYVEVADVSHDGRVDLVVSDAVDEVGGGSLNVMVGDGAGGFAAPRTFAADPQPRTLAVGDFDADGAVDDVAVAHQSGSVLVYVQTNF